ncbi:MAG TPA: LamG domain-containing protein [Terracidiphilus sp.]|nr:LamG domain-containing protein [Terracidiphilus sp.]
MRVALLLLICCVLPACVLHGQERGVDAHWAFMRDQGAAPVDSLHGVKASLGGYYAYVPGIAGEGLRFDGYTTSMTVPYRDTDAQIRDGFTVEAWVALNTYPWNWMPIVDQEQDRQQGLFFGIDAFGHFALDVSMNGQWQTLTSTATLPLKKWAHVAGTYRTSSRGGELRIYLDGKCVGQLPVRGEMLPARADLLIGRVRAPLLPFPEAAAKPQYPIWYSLDGILDELAIYGRALNADEIATEFARASAPAADVLPWPRMPSGPAGPGRFGAYYATLRYQDTWDRLRRIGPDSDVVVRFDDSPVRLVFWQGTNYIPAWVTENGKWYTDEFTETYVRDGCPEGGDCEPMSDKQSRYSHVNILESNNARVVVHWRYALAEVEHYLGAWPDPLTGWFQWTDEYWTVYPDGIAVRKQVVHNTGGTQANEWQETIILHQPGSRPEDDINWDALTLENMNGETKTYTWRPKPAGVLGVPLGPADVTGPPDPNIQLVNMKSRWKPFQIVSPDGAGADIYNNELTYFSFECWNHWPVAQIASSDRPCVADDRASHSSLSHLHWKLYAKTRNTETKILMDGLTTKSAPELLPLARSWLSPPDLQLEGDAYRSGGYDPAERDYVLTATNPPAQAPLRITIAASQSSPAVDPAILIRNWGEKDARLKIDGRPVEWGRDFRAGHIEHLDRTDLIVWLRKESTAPLQIELTPGKSKEPAGQRQR